MKKNEQWTGTCTGYTYDGLGVVRFDDLVFFVPGLLEGEEAELAITAMKKNYGYARIVKLLKKSPHRREPVCGVYRLCGGCQLMHMDDETQQSFKEDKVRNLFLQNAGMEVDVPQILEGEMRLNYRNKVQVPVQVNQGKVEMGFYQNHSNRIIPFETCYVQTEESNQIVQAVKALLEQYRCGSVFRHVLIKHAHVRDEVMVCLIVREYPFRHSEQFIQELTRQFPNICSMSAIINRREDNVILDGKEVLLYGNPYIEEDLLGCRFRISARSFFQINPYATKLLYSRAIEFAGLSGNETVIDLYCGTGTIGILASKHAKQVYGIEVVADAIRDAKVNAEINNVNNIQFFCADAKDGAKKLIAAQIRPDVVIVDPPRKGCSIETLNAIETMSPGRLVYVSCDPATLTRDCAIMKEKGYETVKVQPVDMFPQTVAVETVCLLVNKKADMKVHVRVDMDEYEGIKGGKK